MGTEAFERATSEITQFLIESYRMERGVHAETIIGGAAALAGEFALRGSESDLPADGWVISENANGFLFENEARGDVTLWSIIRSGAERAGAAPDTLPDPVDVVARVAESLGSSPFPPLSVPDRHFPHEWSPNACPKLRGGIEKIGAANGLSARELALALATAVSILIGQTSQLVPPAVAGTLALEIMIGVSRMVPLEVEIR